MESLRLTITEKESNKIKMSSLYDTGFLTNSTKNKCTFWNSEKKLKNRSSKLKEARKEDLLASQTLNQFVRSKKHDLIDNFNSTMSFNHKLQRRSNYLVGKIENNLSKKM